MLDILGQLLDQVKKGQKHCIDNNVFSLHYRLSVLLLILFTVIISSRKYFGDPIDCTTPDALERIVDNFCWYNLFIVVPKDANSGYKHGGLKRFRAVLTSVESLEDLLKPDSTLPYKPIFLHAYQWIEFILFLQAILFFIPRYLWRYCWEQGRVKTLTQDYAFVTVKDGAHKERQKDIVSYFRRNKYDHFEYSWKFIVCEILNFGNVLAQYLIIRSTLGLEWDELWDDFFHSHSNTDSELPINHVFPNIARCEIPLARGAGHVRSQEFCALPVNVFVTKIYIFLWFYFLVLSIISGFALVFRLGTIVSSKFRYLILQRTGRGIKEDCARAIRNLGYGDWFVLNQVGQNMDPLAFKNLIKEYNDSLVASRPSFAIISNEKTYSGDFGALQMRKDSVMSVKTTPKL